MLKRKNNKKRNEHRKIQIIFGSLFIFAGTLAIITKYSYYFSLNQKDNNRVAEYFSSKIESNSKDKSTAELEKTKKDSLNYEYDGVLEIPSISLKRGFVSKNSPHNNVNENIQIIKESDMPNINKGNFILAGHSGNGRVSYFKNLPKLSIGDIANVYYHNKVYKYELVNSYEIEKNGTAKLIRNKNETTMTLITCKTNTNKQIVFIFELQKIL